MWHGPIAHSLVNGGVHRVQVALIDEPDSNGSIVTRVHSDMSTLSAS